MRQEIAPVVNVLTGSEKIKSGSFYFIKGKLLKHDIITQQTGVGKVLTSSSVQHLIDVFKPEAVIMIGIAGSINTDLKKGDTIIAEDCIQHDMDSTAFGFLRGEIPYTNYRIISSDKRLVETASSCKTISLQKGRVLTGDQFINDCDSDKLNYLRENLKGDLVDMEGAAAALVSMINEVPFLLIRTVSDNADGGGGKGFKNLLKISGDKHVTLIKHILENYS